VKGVAGALEGPYERASERERERERERVNGSNGSVHRPYTN